ncbi:MAG: MltA domain-containing protein, partial [Magnetovibrio sp.]|nr:MltA domain-containing protein [Magnetovibrio sp.]
MRAIFSAAIVAAVTAGCAPGFKVTSTPSAPTPAPVVPPAVAPQADKPSKVSLRTTTFSALPGWRADRQADALLAFQKSCQKILKRPLDRLMASNAAAPGGTVANWRSSCQAALDLNTRDDAVARRFFEVWFVPYEVSAKGDDGTNLQGLFTGYYEPELNGAWVQGGKFQTPLYARPADLVSVSLGAFDDELGGTTIWGRVDGGKLKPYPSRSHIENGAVTGLRSVLWVDDPVDAFFLHIQGSGR